MAERLAPAEGRNLRRLPTGGLVAVGSRGTLDGVISTFPALLVALLFLLPGASYTYAYERIVGSYGVSFSDRLVRFLVASAIFQALLSGPETLMYRRFVTTGRLGRGDVNWLVLEVVAVAYVALPSATGYLVGHGQVRGWGWVHTLIGDAPEPRAWDYLWGKARGHNGIVRIKLKSGGWLAGLWATTMGGMKSFAAAYPAEGDLYLSQQVVVDPDSGEFRRDADDQPVLADGSGLLLRWAEIEYIDFMEF